MRWTRMSLLLALCALLALTVFSCSNEPSSPVATSAVQTPGTVGQAATARDGLMQLMTVTNSQLEAAGASFRVGVAEWYGLDDPQDMRTVYFWNVGNKKLGHHWVPGDPRRAAWSTGTSITYTVDTAEGATTSGLTSAQTTAAIDRAMDTWQNVECSTIPLVRLPDAPFSGYVQWANGIPGGSPNIVADYTHGGWFPAGILNPNVIGVTFTYIWTNGGVPTDIDNNGRLDTAFRETYYNDLFNWRIDPGCQLCPLIDVETVALHEAGHGLSQGHFGQAFRDGGAGGLHFAPHALMNAGYSGQNQVVAETDLAGHCAVWGSWPER